MFLGIWLKVASQDMDRAKQRRERRHRPQGHPCVAEGVEVMSEAKASRSSQVPCSQCLTPLGAWRP